MTNLPEYRVERLSRSSLAAASVSTTTMLDPSALSPMMSVSEWYNQSTFQLRLVGWILTILAAPTLILQPRVLMGGRYIAHVPDKREARRSGEAPSTPPRAVEEREAGKGQEAERSSNDVCQRCHRRMLGLRVGEEAAKLWVYICGGQVTR